MRRFLPILMLLAAVTLVAQQSAPSSTTPPSTEAENNYGFPPAPKPGHPLDPNDVATLTGKNNQNQPQQNYATPQVYYTAPVGGSMFTQSAVGDAFVGGSNVGYGMVGYNYGGYGYGGYNGYGYGLGNGSQFANVSTATRPPLGFGATGRPGASPFFGTGRPGQFGGNRWRPNVWFGPGAHFQHPTGQWFSPNPRP
jgi:hypothetical protein